MFLAELNKKIKIAGIFKGDKKASKKVDKAPGTPETSVPQPDAEPPR